MYICVRTKIATIDDTCTLSCFNPVYVLYISLILNQTHFFSFCKNEQLTVNNKHNEMYVYLLYNANLVLVQVELYPGVCRVGDDGHSYVLIIH